MLVLFNEVTGIKVGYPISDIHNMFCDTALRIYGSEIDCMDLPQETPLIRIGFNNGDFEVFDAKQWVMNFE